MTFYGIEKNSLNDYEGKISCVLFISKCNFFCPYCHNPRIITNKNLYNINIKNIIKHIKKRKNIYEGVVISGGEPTINNKLEQICRYLKKINYLVKLDTNGSNPNIIYKLLNKNLLDYISMDIKTIPTKYEYKKFTNDPNISNKIKKSIKIIMSEATNYEFRTTCIHPLINVNKIKKISKIIKGAKKYTLQPFNQKTQQILNKNFFQKTNPIIPIKNIIKFQKIANQMVKKCHISSI